MSGYKEMRSTEQAETNQLIIIFIFLLTTSTQSDSDIPQWHLHTHALKTKKAIVCEPINRASHENAS